MKIRFEEKINNRYMLVCPEKSETGFSSYTYRMILENRIKGTVPCRRGNLDGRAMLYYNVTGLMQVSEYLREHSADGEFLKHFLRELASVTEELQRYLIGSENLILDPEQIFVASDTGEFRFAVCFDDRSTFSDNLLKFSEYLIPRLPTNNHTAAAMGYELYQNCVNGSVTAASLRRIAAYGISRDAADLQAFEPEEDMSISVSEDDIFIPADKRAKRIKRRKAVSWKEKMHTKAETVKKNACSFMRRLSE